MNLHLLHPGGDSGDEVDVGGDDGKDGPHHCGVREEAKVGREGGVRPGAGCSMCHSGGRTRTR